MFAERGAAASACDFVGVDEQRACAEFFEPGSHSFFGRVVVDVHKGHRIAYYAAIR